MGEAMLILRVNKIQKANNSLYSMGEVKLRWN